MVPVAVINWIEFYGIDNNFSRLSGLDEALGEVSAGKDLVSGI